MKQKKNGLVNIYLFATDFLAMICAFFIGLLFWHYAYKMPDSWDEGILLFASYIIVYVFFESVSDFLKRTKIEELLHIIKMTVVIGMVFTFLLFITKYSNIIYRMIFLISLIAFVIFDFLMRFCLKLILSRSRIKSGDRIMLVTMREDAEEVVKSVNEGIETTRRITAVIIADDDARGETIVGVPVVGNVYDMFDFAKNEIVDEVMIKVPYQTGKSFQNYIDQFEAMGIVVHVVFHEIDGLDEYQRSLDLIGKYPVVSFETTTHSPEKLLIKRMIDIVGGLIGSLIAGALTVLLTPFIFIESPGPIFFKQKRVGLNGRYFYIYKFRSMYPDAEKRKKELMEKNEMSGQMFKMTNDPRITKVGRFLRATSLDEFPQFFNILKGDMSLIGTRPPTVDEFKAYEGYHKRRLSMKPGLTGMWQVSGRSDITDFEEVVRMDCYYIDHWSLGLDIKILLKTFVVVFRREGSK